MLANQQHTQTRTDLKHAVQNEQHEEGKGYEVDLGAQRNVLACHPVAHRASAQHHCVQRQTRVQHWAEPVQAGDEQQVPCWHVGCQDDGENDQVTGQRPAGFGQHCGHHGDASVVAQYSQQAEGDDESQGGQQVAVGGVPDYGQVEIHVFLLRNTKQQG